ncbi:unnamed protein product [Clavelina lepadiformis]|uniref:Uncharacterized protein n=1 Tax=Clavelina lepadiformis TaxID=159417 RepID=A0ABP0G7A3_CLALP
MEIHSMLQEKNAMHWLCQSDKDLHQNQLRICGGSHTRRTLDPDNEVSVRYCLDGNLLYTRCLTPQTKTFNEHIFQLQYADDTGLERLQDGLSTTNAQVGLIIRRLKYFNHPSAHFLRLRGLFLKCRSGAMEKEKS